jgi:hypothetical protein
MVPGIRIVYYQRARHGSNITELIITIIDLVDPLVIILILSAQSATTSRAGGMRMAPGRGRAHLCWWPLIFKKNFLISVLPDLSVLMTT